MKLYYDQSTIGKILFPSIIWNSSNDKLLLTFDDAPTKECLPEILKFLDDKKIKALFFCVGENIKKNPELAKEILTEGHTIGNHTYNHIAIVKQSDRQTRDQVLKFELTRMEILGNKSRYFRPPHGKINCGKKKLIESLGLKIVMWSLLTWDFKGNIQLCKKGIEKYLKKNSIIVFHDNIKSKKILIEGLSFLYEISNLKKFSFGVPEECLN